MRKDYINLIAKVAKKFHLVPLAYNICRCWPAAPRVPQDFDAEGYLSSVWPDKGQSCLMENEIASSPEFDLELIVPVYNASAYLDECIQSLFTQKTSYKYRAIFVNDGSRDDSLSILRRYEQDPRVKIIDQQNGGAASARNHALSHINARYITFLDADDMLPQDAIQVWVSKADALGVDMVEGSHVYFAGDKILQRSIHRGDTSGIEPFHVMACSRIYRSEVWQHVGFPVGYWYEDTVDVMFVYPMWSRKATISDVVYLYRENMAGASKSTNTNPRRIETYWVTRRTLRDAMSFGVPVSEEFYYRFLRQCKTNTCRVATLGNRVADYAVFQGMRQLMFEYFAGMKTDRADLRPIERYLIANDFSQYYYYCLFHNV